MPSAGDAGVTQPNPDKIKARRSAVRRGSAALAPTIRRSWIESRPYATASVATAASSHTGWASASAFAPPASPVATETAT